MKQLLNIASPKFKHVKNCKLLLMMALQWFLSSISLDFNGLYEGILFVMMLGCYHSSVMI
jgi:hypothetical protein